MTDLTSICRLLEKFTPEVLSALIPMVMGIEWEEIRTLLIDNKLSLRKNFITQAAVSIYEEKQPTKADLGILSRKLKFFDVVRNVKIEWQCVRLDDQVSSFLNVHKLEQDIISIYKREGRNTDVLIYEEEPLAFVMSTEKKITKKGIKHSLPLYFVIHTALATEKYFFYSATADKNNHQIEYFCKALGYNSYSSVPLTGKDVRSMFQIIKRSQELIDDDIPDFDPVRVVEEDGIVDFTLGKERCKYAEQLFPGLTNLNTFTVHANNRWQGSSNIGNDENDRFLTTLTFSTTRKGVYVEDIFKEFVKAGMVKMPLPTYLVNMTKVPKNNVSLHEGNSEDSFMDESY